MVHGALLNVFINWLDHDGIFVSSPMIAIPTLLIGDGKLGDIAAAKRIMKGTLIFSSLANWLAEEHEAGDVQEVALTLSTITQEGVLKLSKQ